MRKINFNIIKYIVMDVDGTLTDGKINISENGELYKSFNIKDGCGISLLLPKHNIVPVVLTARKSNSVALRMRELNVKEVYQGISDKLGFIKKFAKKHKVLLKAIAYIGDDIPDIETMSACGFSACPKDAANCVKNISDYISRHNGGDGAVRDIIEFICFNKRL